MDKELIKPLYSYIITTIPHGFMVGKEQPMSLTAKQCWSLFYCIFSVYPANVCKYSRRMPNPPVNHQFLAGRLRLGITVQGPSREAVVCLWGQFCPFTKRTNWWTSKPFLANAFSCILNLYWNNVNKHVAQSLHKSTLPLPVSSETWGKMGCRCGSNRAYIDWSPRESLDRP